MISFLYNNVMIVMLKRGKEKGSSSLFRYTWHVFLSIVNPWFYAGYRHLNRVFEDNCSLN